MTDFLPFVSNGVVGAAVFGTMVWLMRHHREELNDIRHWYDESIGRLEARLDSIEKQQVRTAAEADEAGKRADRHSAGIKKRPTHSTVRAIAAEIRDREK